MGITEAISSAMSNITNFEGRASRPAFWYWALFLFILDVVVGLVFGRGTGFLAFLAYIVYLVLWLATVAVGCRRLHDTGKSGWLQLIALVPCVGFIILIVFWVMPGTPGDNAYGPVPAA